MPRATWGEMAAATPHDSRSGSGKPGCLVFVDESGDLGLKPGSSPFFTVTLLLFSSRQDAHRANAKIEALRAALKKPHQFEFHFSKLSDALRERFFREVGDCPCFYFAMSVNKAKLTGPGFGCPDSFYKYTTRLAFENAQAYLRAATVVIDGSGGRQFKSELRRYLDSRVRDHEGSHAIKKLRVEDSHRNNLLQMADMFCGAVARSLSGRKDAKHYLRMIAHREVSRRLWPNP